MNQRLDLFFLASSLQLSPLSVAVTPHTLDSTAFTALTVFTALAGCHHPVCSKGVVPSSNNSGTWVVLLPLCFQCGHVATFPRASD